MLVKEEKKAICKFDKKCKLKKVDNIIGARIRLHNIPKEHQTKIVQDAKEQITKVVLERKFDLSGKEPFACKYIGYFCRSVVRDYLTDNTHPCSDTHFSGLEGSF